LWAGDTCKNREIFFENLLINYKIKKSQKIDDGTKIKVAGTTCRIILFKKKQI